MSTIAKYNYNQFFEQPEIIKPSMNELNAQNHYNKAFLILTFSVLAIGISYYLLNENKKSIDFLLKQNESK